MIRICCKCGKVLGEKEPVEDKSETHTLCDRCLRIFLFNLEFKGKPLKIRFAED
jgi:hypothetical protein